MEHYEVHLTVRPVPAPPRYDGLKFTHIELPVGAVPSQPMYTGRGRGTATDRRARAQRWARMLRADGLDVMRVKIELDARAVPFARLYYEHHVKVLLAADADATALAASVAPHGAHVSRNARRHRPDGRAERFVTQRCHRVALADARARLDALLGELAGVPILDVEAECVEYDDNPAVDAGWLP